MKQKAKPSQAKNHIDLSERLISVNRVSKTVKGGKNMSFAVLMVVGDKNGRVGFGKGNASEVTEARAKAVEAAKKSMVKIYLKESRTIHYDITSRYCAAKVHLRSAPTGTGVIAGGPMRAVFECVGISDIVAKSIGTSNPYNLVAATFKALTNLYSPKVISDLRSKDISEVVKKRNFIVQKGTNQESKNDKE
jgi:small subunit ribosomal protein S5